MNRLPSLGLALIVAGSLAACNGGGTPTTVGAISPSGALAITGAPVVKAARPLSASGIVLAIADKVGHSEHLTTSYAVPANTKVARGHFRSKASFADSRIHKSDVKSLHSGDVGEGGSVEVYRNAALARTRLKALTKLSRSNPQKVKEYDYSAATDVLRLSRYLSPAERRRCLHAFRAAAR
jgi:hypothetical protein